ncbi:MAG: MFS transporter [Pseudomonadota bacterium]
MATARFPQFSLFAGMLAFAGLPLYIHAPKFFADEYGVSLSVLGIALLAVRSLDFIQDPFLGWFADVIKGYQAATALFAAVLMAGGMVALFGIAPPINPLWWFVICLAILFTAFSFLNILFYSQGVATARRFGARGHIQLAAWREAGALIGICIAAALPSILEQAGSTRPMAVFAGVFAVIAIGAAMVMYSDWSGVEGQQSRFWDAFKDHGIQRLMLLGVLNSAPVAVSSTLFLFFVGDRLGSESAAGPLLLFFFLAAALAVPVWTRISDKIGAKKTLLWGMSLSILAFMGALFLAEGHFIAFGLICIASGAALGADMTFLPALFARRVDTIDMPAGIGFGLWNFCTKLSLALAAAIVLPALDQFGFETGVSNDKQALFALTLLYAGLPCLLKIAAFMFLVRTELGETT